MSAIKAPPGPQPLIPEKYFDVPTQRLYALSFVALVQVRPISFLHYAHYDHKTHASNSPSNFPLFAFSPIAYYGGIQLLNLQGHQNLRLGPIPPLRLARALWSKMAFCGSPALSGSLATTNTEDQLFAVDSLDSGPQSLVPRRSIIRRHTAPFLRGIIT